MYNFICIIHYVKLFCVSNIEWCCADTVGGIAVQTVVPAGRH
jgi:hypothetical protein